MKKQVQRTMAAIAAVAIVSITTLSPLSVLASSVPTLSDVQLVIDPGHGGTDPGAVAMHNGVQVTESEIVLDVSLRLQRLLTQTGMNISMTRSTDVFIPLIDRSNFANNKGADLFVSVHGNAATNTAATGIETYYFGAQVGRSNDSEHHGMNTSAIRRATSNREQDSRLLAEKIQARLVERLQLNDRGVKQGNFSVIRETNMASVLAELGFITNEGDRTLLMSDEGRDLAAEGLYLGILDYLVAQGYVVPDHLFNLVGDNGDSNIEEEKEDPDMGDNTPDSNTGSNNVRQGQTTDNLNVRTGNSTSHSIVTTLPKGTNLNILEEQNGWFRIEAGNITGWVSAQFVRLNNDENDDDDHTTGGNREGQTTARLNMRMGPGTSHGIIKTLPLGQTVTILSESNGWMRVRVGNEDGWVSSEFVKVTNGSSSDNNVGSDNDTSTSTTRQGQTTANLNMRTGAGTNFSIIRTLASGTAVTILSESNGWMRVRVGNQEGWVSSEWVRVTNGDNSDTSNGSGNDTSTSTTRQGQTTANLNMRTGAGTNHSIIRTLASGTSITILSESNGWMRVRVGNQEGWVSSEWVRVTSENSSDNNNGSGNDTSTSTTRQGQTTANLNMRTGAGTNHSIIRTLPSGTSITILSESNGWMRVRAGNEEGWVSSEWVRETSGNSNSSSDSTRQGQTTANLNMRTGAGTNYSIIRTLPLGTNITILSESNGWMRVRAGTQEGWVSAEWVK